MTCPMPGGLTKAPDPMILDDSLLGCAWTRAIEYRRSIGHPSVEVLKQALPRLPSAVKSGALSWPAHWAPVPPLRLDRPALHNTATDSEIADHFVLHICDTRVTPKPTDSERRRARLVRDMASKIRGLRSEIHALGLTERDVFWVLAYSEAADGKQVIRELIRPSRWAVFNELSDRPGSAMSLLDALAPAATHAFLPPRMWNPVDPPRVQSTATLDALLCVLSVFLPRATVDLAVRCAIAFYPGNERGIRKRAAEYLVNHSPELRPREGLSWGAGELSPLILRESSVTA